MKLTALALGALRGPDTLTTAFDQKVEIRDRQTYRWVATAFRVDPGDWRTWRGGTSFPTLLRLVRDIARRHP